MKRGLNSLATITSIAPLVGLFGTIWGIMNSFPGMGIDKATGLAVVTGRLSLACASAALGLLTALQSLWCHRYLTGRLEDFDGEMEDTSIELVNQLTIHLQHRGRIGNRRFRPGRSR
jgi:biopolymer transport protein ExbB/TolQ